ncbi:MAG: 50S ribosomal protein L16 [Candidatus Aenigmarchaeota archaeon ex4484_56]|nr:MAG: 50S ribosomal protein L16 [Candidatus Aenigmarchaeota archaeon ex4484_56]
MAKLRPSRCYRTLKRPWTRQSKKKPRISYVKGVPNTRIRRYVTGINKVYDSKYFIVSKDSLQVRDNAIEAARVAISNYLQKHLKQNFYLILRKYPFHVLREHKQAAVAGADRYFSGMRHAFGKPCGQAVQLYKNNILFELRIDKKNDKLAREALKRAIAKLPGGYTIVVE